MEVRVAYIGGSASWCIRQRVAQATLLLPASSFFWRVLSAGVSAVHAGVSSGVRHKCTTCVLRRTNMDSSGLEPNVEA